MKDGELADFIGENGHFSTIFDFSAHCLSDGEHGWYDAPAVSFQKWRDTIIHAQLDIQKYGMEANIIENHDEPRGVSRFLPEYAQTPAGTKMLGTVNILLRGIPFIYQGQEIGMQNAVWNSIEEYDDISTKDQYHIARKRMKLPYYIITKGLWHCASRPRTKKSLHTVHFPRHLSIQKP